MGRVVDAGVGDSSLADYRLQFNNSSGRKHHCHPRLVQSGNLRANRSVSYGRDTDTPRQLSAAFEPERTPSRTCSGQWDGRGLRWSPILGLVLYFQWPRTDGCHSMAGANWKHASSRVSTGVFLRHHPPPSL